MTVAGIEFDHTRLTVGQFNEIAAWYHAHTGNTGSRLGAHWDTAHGIKESPRRARCRCGAILVVEDDDE